MADIDKLFDIDISSGIKLWGEVINTHYSLVMDLDVIAPAAGSRGVFAGGYVSAPSNIIDFITISTPGAAADFGDLTIARYAPAAFSNGTNDRGVFSGGNGAVRVIDYITISTPSTCTDWGDLTVARFAPAGFSNGTNERGITSGGNDGSASDVIDYITISTPSTCTDWGDLIQARSYVGGCSNGTNERGTTNGGWISSGVGVTTIDYITISTPSTCTFFGAMTVPCYYTASCSNGTNERGVILIGSDRSIPATSDDIVYITINTPSNATTFGDLSAGARYGVAATSNKENERGVFAGGYTGSNTDTIEYVTINTTGNSTDFGDLTVARRYPVGTSNA